MQQSPPPTEVFAPHSPSSPSSPLQEDFMSRAFKLNQFHIFKKYIHKNHRRYEIFSFFFLIFTGSVSSVELAAVVLQEGWSSTGSG